MSDQITRRKFIQSGGAVALGTLMVGSVAEAAAVPSKKVIALADVKPWTPVSFGFPENELAVLLNVDKSVPGGVGPHRSIVAFSALCQHMGCPVAFDEKTRSLKCPCHASMFDPVRDGMAFEGPATRGLPVIQLKIDGGNIYATGVATGLVYGRACNKT